MLFDLYLVCRLTWAKLAWFSVCSFMSLLASSCSTSVRYHGEINLRSPKISKKKKFRTPQIKTQKWWNLQHRNDVNCLFCLPSTLSSCRSSVISPTGGWSRVNRSDQLTPLNYCDNCEGYEEEYFEDYGRRLWIYCGFSGIFMMTDRVAPWQL